MLYTREPLLPKWSVLDNSYLVPSTAKGTDWRNGVTREEVRVECRFAQW